MQFDNSLIKITEKKSKEKNNIFINLIRFVIIILLIGTFCIIFGFSNQNGQESTKMSSRFSRKVIDVTSKNISKEEKTKKTFRIEPIVRKLAHFSIYLIVGILLMGLSCTYKLNVKNKFIICLLIGFIYACSDEIHQLFINERSGQIFDIFLDTIGVAEGTVIMCFCYLNLLKKKENKKM